MSLQRNITTTLIIAGLLISDTGHTQTLNFNLRGDYYRPTCVFEVNNGRDVNIGTHDANIFTGVGSASPWEAFDITSGGCSGSVTRVHMRWSGTPNPDNNTLYAVPGVTGVGIQIQSFDNYAAGPNRNVVSWAPRAAGAAYSHKARFVQTLATVGTGTGSATVTINITYN
ncbi:fimbrial protein [Stenotrophomonas rhizophila]|uniref:Type 1 fimbria pilin n=1 Tax=Stenotrophomonas rhizophila TaxID=216778 RepID=A0AAW5PJP7_9GAMM|nr:fimbrial protein [Stenotrophomonas rhizophila]MCS4280139.1 type 1 fimbria pilin [Stenotrophomonas rhizophila]